MRWVAALICVAGSLACSGQTSVEKATKSRVMGPGLTAASKNNLSPKLTDERVAFLVKKWQRRLGLGDWILESKIVRAWDLPDNAVANIHWSLPTKHATVKVLNSADSTLSKSEVFEDTELSVIHELVHLSMAKLPLDSKHTETEEEAVKKISQALLMVDKHRL